MLNETFSFNIQHSTFPLPGGRWLCYTRSPCSFCTTHSARPIFPAAASPPSAISTACTSAIRRSSAASSPAPVITFHPHPLSIVAPDRVPKQILTLDQKQEILHSMGVDEVLIIPFTHDFSRWTADRFISEFLVSALNV